MPEATPQVCEHLQKVLDYAVARGAAVTFAGQAWSRNCRTWVYLDRVLSVEGLVRRFGLGPPVRVHTHRGTHDGSEHGLVCDEHHDAIMGIHPAEGRGCTLD